MECKFCAIAMTGEDAYVVHQTELSTSFLDINPIADGHTLVVPKVHSELIWDMDKKDYLALMDDVRVVAGILQETMGSKTVGIAVEGLSVPHTHVHLVPVNSINALNPSLARPATPDELAEIHRRITQGVGKGNSKS